MNHSTVIMLWVAIFSLWFRCACDGTQEINEWPGFSEAKDRYNFEAFNLFRIVRFINDRMIRMKEDEMHWLFYVYWNKKEKTNNHALNSKIGKEKNRNKWIEYKQLVT